GRRCDRLLAAAWRRRRRVINRRPFIRRLVDHDAFERTRTPLVELETAGDRLEPHLHVFRLDAEPRELEDEVVHHLVVELIDRPLARKLFRVQSIQARLDVQRLDQRIRVQEQLEDRIEQLADPPDRPAVRFVERRILERIVGQIDGRLRAAELLEQIGSHAARIQELLELDGGELADLLLGIVDAALFANARANLLHDLLDVHGVGADVEIGHKHYAGRAAGPDDTRFGYNGR